MARMSYKEIQNVVATYVAAAKQAGTYTASYDNLAKLVDKIAKSITLDGNFNDKLPQLDGEELPLGKTIEEYYQDLCAVLDYNDYKLDDSNAANDALKPYYPSYEEPAYSYSLGRKKMPTTIKYDEYERAVNTPEELVVITNTVLKRLYDTNATFRYNAKKQIIANAIAKAVAAQSTSGATNFPASSALTKGTRYYSGTRVGICKKASTSGYSTFDAAINDGAIVEFKLVSELALPVDTTTGEAFIKEVKKQVEAAQFVTEGNSLSGATIGAADGMLLIVTKGVNPSIDVDTLSGAFNMDKLAIPAEMVVVDDFGTDTNNVFACLVDKRAMRLHPTYNAVREQLNGSGDFVNYFLHTDNTAFISKNCFMHFFKVA